MFFSKEFLPRSTKRKNESWTLVEIGQKDTNLQNTCFCKALLIFVFYVLQHLFSEELTYSYLSAVL